MISELRRFASGRLPAIASRRASRLQRSLGRRFIILACLAGIWGASINLSKAQSPLGRDLFSDTWVGHDALGRNLPDYSVVGPIKTDHRRVVGIFYITWHSDSLHKLKGPYSADVSRVLA